MTIARPTDNDDLSHISADLRPLAVHIDYIDVDPNNANENHDKEGLDTSIDEFGQDEPLLANLIDGRLVSISGSGRLERFRARGWQWIAVTVVEYDEHQHMQRAHNANRLVRSSEMNAIKLGEQLKLLEDTGKDSMLSGFSPAALNNALALAAMAQEDGQPPSLDKLKEQYGEPEARQEFLELVRMSNG